MANSETHEIVLVDGDDWKGIYIDGVVKHQGHSIPTHVWGELLETGPYTFREVQADVDWLSSLGWLPEHLSDVRVVQ